jgi:hypothetical protein
MATWPAATVRTNRSDPQDAAWDFSQAQFWGRFSVTLGFIWQMSDKGRFTGPEFEFKFADIKRKGKQLGVE